MIGQLNNYITCFKSGIIGRFIAENNIRPIRKGLLISFLVFWILLYFITLKDNINEELIFFGTRSLSGIKLHGIIFSAVILLHISFFISVQLTLWLRGADKVSNSYLFWLYAIYLPLQLLHLIISFIFDFIIDSQVIDDFFTETSIIIFFVCFNLVLRIILKGKKSLKHCIVANIFLILFIIPIITTTSWLAYLLGHQIN